MDGDWATEKDWEAVKVPGEAPPPPPPSEIPWTWIIIGVTIAGAGGYALYRTTRKK